MATLDLNGHFFHRFQMDTFLGQGNRGGGFDSHIKDQGHTVGNAAKYSTAMVGHGFYPAVLQEKGIVCLAAGEAGKVMAAAEAHGLDSRNGKEDPAQMAFHTSKHGSTQAKGNAGDGAADAAANAVAMLLRLQDLLLHGIIKIIAGTPSYAADLQDLRLHEDALCLQPLLAKPTGNAQGRCQAAGEGATAGHIKIQAVFHPGGKIRMSGPGNGLQGIVIGSFHIFIVEDGFYGLTGGVCILQTMQEMGNVPFLAGGAAGGFTRGATVQKGLQRGKIHRKTGRDLFHAHADMAVMGGTENGQFQVVSVFTLHNLPPNR